MSDAATPTHIFFGSIVTMDDAKPTAEAMAISNNKIVAVGSRAEIEPLASPETQRVDLGSRVLYPGLIESHMHIWLSAMNYNWIDCSVFANKSLDEIKQKIADAASKAQPGTWVCGKLFDPSLLPNSPSLTFKDLDPLAPNNPVFILNASGHFAYVNSKALEMAQISLDAQDPAGGTYGRDESGKLNGIVGEMGAMLPLMKLAGKMPDEELLENICKVVDDAARVGVTSMREAGTGGLMGAKEIEILHQLQTAGKLKTRLSLALFDDSAKDWPESPETAYGAGDEFVWIGARKLVSDGSNQGESGFQTEPYLHSKDRGKFDYPTDYFKERIKWCHENGWQIMVHANGNAAIDIVTKTYDEVIGHDDKDLRHRIEHCSLVDNDSLFETMAKVGVTPSFLINHVYYWGKTLRDNVLGADRIYMLDRTASALKAGLKFTMHSDYNVSPINPLQYVKVAVTRTMWDGGEVLGEDQKVTVDQALRAVTIDAAWQIHCEDKFGSLSVGKFADFVILENDPQKVAPETIADIKVMETWRGGEKTYQAG